MHERAPERATRGRVRCTQRSRITGRPCQAERILALSDTCFVCGGAVFERVAPSTGDLPCIHADLAHLVADLLSIDPSPVNFALANALAEATGAHLTVVALREDLRV